MDIELKTLSAKLGTGMVPTVQLAHEIHGALTSKSPVVVMHGLFGSKQNWRALGKQLAHRTARQVVAVDLRNHGDSLHAEPHNYRAMAADVRALCDTLYPVVSPVILGHSMGGKTAMLLALESPSRFSALVSVDIAPRNLNLTSLFGSYIDSMRSVIDAKVSSHKEADAILAKSIPELSIRQFLLTNLKFSPSASASSPSLAFRVNLNVLYDALKSNPNGNIGIAGFPETEGSYNGPALFIRGLKSGYVPDSSIPRIKQLFPAAQIVGIEGAGHWVHSEKPVEFVKALEDFLKDVD
ncbi:hypothetical protein HK100_000216 [Physocladia obscura]|uniref:AB hydrolase-1 domain-containing protein n=1 Tax=Physocladia obscura TaxID=109957 RepID=A0AAD5XFC9_9FUNG|nr:hypothetical protein HK100_000216 [Physocladia obscura]